jgi:hypothetical protein
VTAWRRQLPYAVAPILTLIGVAYTSCSKRPIVGYWELLTVVMTVLCVSTGWRPSRTGRPPAIDLDTGSALARVSGRNEPSVVDQQQTMLNADALGFAILMLLALGTLSPMGCSCAELEQTHLHPQTSR